MALLCKTKPIDEECSMKITKLIPISIMVLLLAACGSSATETSEAPSAFGSPGGAYSPQMRLSMGTFLLEDTDLAVTPEQAAELLPLWEAVLSLSESDTAAQAEIDALYDQIEETMTADQMQAIAEMNPTQDDIAALMESLGLDNTNAAGGFQGGNPPQGFNPDDLPEGFSPGNFPGGRQMGPGGGQGQGQGGGMFGGDIDPETLATMEARREEMGGSFRNRTNLFLVEPLIELLQERAAS
jgi:hypothetical protein